MKPRLQVKTTQNHQGKLKTNLCLVDKINVDAVDKTLSPLWNLVPNSIHVMWNATGRAIFSVNLRKPSKSSDPFAIDFGHVDLSNCNLFVSVSNHLKARKCAKEAKIKVENWNC